MKTQQQYYTPEEYLKLEEAAEYKSEYLDGQIVPMAGGSTNHNQIALNFSTELNFAFIKTKLSGIYGRCSVVDTRKAVLHVSRCNAYSGRTRVL